MPTLHIAYEDGFEDDTVTISIDGKPALRREALKSSLATALAATQTIDVPAGKVTLRVEIPKRGIAASLSLDASQSPHLGIAVREGQLVLRPQAEPPVYF